MSALNDLKENFKSKLQESWAQFQESDTYTRLNDVYENLTPPQQKALVIGGAALAALIVVSMPYGKFVTANETIEQFESNKDTIIDLRDSTRDAAAVPNLPPTPNSDSLQAEIRNHIQAANLLPEQVVSVGPDSANSSLIASEFIGDAIKVQLAKLNLNQILDFGYKFQSRGQNVKVKDMIMTANREDARYYDVTFKIITIKVPEAPMPQPEESNNRRRGR